ncbi:MAG: ComEA family DNA-binding protein [Ilumatobacteraceae bacterium]
MNDRSVNGPFSSVDDLVRVSGVGPATVEKLRDVVSV